MTRAVCVLVAAMALQACGAVSAPDLPPVLTLEFPELQLEAAGAVTGESLTALAHSADRDDGDHRDRARARNVRRATDLLEPVARPLKQRLFWPRSFVEGLAKVAPRQTDEGWVWTETFRLQGFEASMVAERVPDDARVEFELRVTGLRGALTRFSNALVLRGSSTDDSQDEGSWLVTDLESGKPGATVNWKLPADGIKELLVTGATDEDKEEGRQLRAMRDGEQVRLLFRKPGRRNVGGNDNARENIEVAWNTATGAGRVSEPGEDDLCWETASNDRADIPCPPGEWP